MHSPVVTPHFKIGVGVLDDHQPDTRPEEEASPKDRRIPAHTRAQGFYFRVHPSLHLSLRRLGVIVKQQLL